MGKRTNSSLSALIECDWCHSGIGAFIYQSKALEGQYCTSDHYAEAMMKKMNWEPELEPEENEQ